MENFQKTFYLIIIAIFLLILVFRISDQTSEINYLMSKTREEGFSFLNTTESNYEKKEPKSFSTSNGKVAFLYDFDWQKAKNQDLLDLWRFLDINTENNFTEEDFEALTESINPEDLFQDENQNDVPDFDYLKNDSLIETERLLLLQKIKTPSLSMGFLSFDKVLNKKMENIDYFEEFLISSLKEKEVTNKVEIIEIKKEENIVLITSKSLNEEFPILKTKTLGLFGSEKYILSLTTHYHLWDEFEEEFDFIISSVEFNVD